MDLSGLEVWLIIILVVGVIASNLAVLKYSAKFKMPQLGDHKDKKIVDGKSDLSETANSDDDTKTN